MRVSSEQNALLKSKEGLREKIQEAQEKTRSWDQEYERNVLEAEEELGKCKK